MEVAEDDVKKLNSEIKELVERVKNHKEISDVKIGAIKNYAFLLFSVLTFLGGVGIFGIYTKAVKILNKELPKMVQKANISERIDDAIKFQKIPDQVKNMTTTAIEKQDVKELINERVRLTTNDITRDYEGKIKNSIKAFSEEAFEKSNEMIISEIYKEVDKQDIPTKVRVRINKAISDETVATQISNNIEKVIEKITLTYKKEIEKIALDNENEIRIFIEKYSTYDDLKYRAKEAFNKNDYPGALDFYVKAAEKSHNTSNAQMYNAYLELAEIQIINDENKDALRSIQTVSKGIKYEGAETTKAMMYFFE